jgi:hypothetical protein
VTTKLREVLATIALLTLSACAPPPADRAQSAAFNSMLKAIPARQGTAQQPPADLIAPTEAPPLDYSGLKPLDDLVAPPKIYHSSLPPVKAEPSPSEVGSQYYKKVAECWDRYDKKQLKTFTQATNCADANVVENLERAGAHDMDVVRWMAAEHVAIAERVDRKKITPKEGRAAWARVESSMVTEFQRRNAIAVQERAEAQAQADAALRAEAARLKAEDARQDAKLQAMKEQLWRMQQQRAYEDAARSAAMIGIGTRLLSPTYVGPSQSSMPTITNCRWIGSQFQCIGN